MTRPDRTRLDAESMFVPVGREVIPDRTTGWTACEDHIARLYQNFETPQGRAAQEAERARRAAKLDAAIIRWAKRLFVAVALIWGFALLAHALPIAAHHIAFPAKIQH